MNHTNHGNPAPARATQGIDVGPGGGRPRRGSPGLLLATASATCALITLDTNIVAVSLPSIARAFHAGFADAEWVVSAYMVSFASCLLPMGALADRYGRKRMMLLGLLAFAAASLACGLASGVLFLNLARAAKGVGAAMLLTAALAVIAHAFPDARERARAWAIWGMTMGIATTVAPLVGGVITQWVGWRGIFLLNLPVCAVLLGCAWRAVDESRNAGAKRVDVAGSALFGAGLASGIWALIGAQDAGWHGAATLLRLAACALLLAGFVRLERRRPHAMIDLALFGQPRFVAAVLGMFGYAACAQVMMTFLPLYLQNAFGCAAVRAGVGMLPFAVAMVAGPYLGARLSHRLPGAAMLSAGLALVGAGNLLTALVAARGGYGPVALGMIVTGLGAGVLNGDTQKAIMACVPPERTGMASGISITTRFTAIVTSIGVLGAVLASRTHAALGAALAAQPTARARLDARFMSGLLAGDPAHAIGALPAALRASVAAVAPGSFASGFAAALSVAGGLAIAVAVLVWRLGAAGRRVARADTVRGRGRA
ncbi:MFS transporter [Burkholderia plantarii]|uniref:MFS transporter n=1 Tax=Burkholderia plantarii TaxID=41899 RepID=UPI0018DB363A|nr:MFS transporter [Burkholderia plantarii]MBI0327385.1 MFS transporter [Burkholderia plantarii]